MIEKNRFLEIMSKLGDVETSATERVELIAELNDDYAVNEANFASLNESTEKLTKTVNDLTQANAIMLLKMGATQTQAQEHQEQVTHSQTITLEQIEGGL